MAKGALTGPADQAAAVDAAKKSSVEILLAACAISN